MNKIKYETETTVHATQEKIELEKELQTQQVQEIREKLKYNEVEWKEPLWTSDVLD